MIYFKFLFDIGVGVVYMGECMFVYVLEGKWRWVGGVKVCLILIVILSV